MKHAIKLETWAIAGEGFTLSRGTRREALLVHLTLEQNGMSAQSEAAPIKRFGYTVETEKEALEDFFAAHQSFSRQDIQSLLKPSPARNALDCALWALEAKAAGKSLAAYADITPKRVPTAFTLSAASPEKMTEQALASQGFRWLKMKLLGDTLDAARIKAVHTACPDTDLIIDANEALTAETLQALLPVCVANRVVLIEQPLPADKDDILRDIQSSIPFAADESCHTSADLEKLRGKYQVVNIKLDKTGGLTEALQLKNQARALGFGIMVGCMVSTSLGLYPAYLLAQDADYIDLDGALLLERDRPNCEQPMLQIFTGGRSAS